MTRIAHIRQLALLTFTDITRLTRAEWHALPDNKREYYPMKHRGSISFWNAGFSPDRNHIVTPGPITRLTLRMYTSLLHELGHANDHDAIHRTFDSRVLIIGDEIYAWKWALSHHREWDSKCTEQLCVAIDSYTEGIFADETLRFLYAPMLQDIEALKALAASMEVNTGAKCPRVPVAA